MTLTIDIKPELESRLRDEAARTGVAAGDVVVQALEQRLSHSAQPVQPNLPAAESRLLLKINASPAGLDWDRYHILLSRNRDETITPDEHRELIAMILTVENANAQRVACLVELARIRGVSLDSVLESLDIRPAPVE